MASIFGKDPSNQPVAPSFARERIEEEIAHLKKPLSIRYGQNPPKTYHRYIFFGVLFVIAGLYFMDPFVFSWYKGDAVQAYLYLHNYGDDPKAQVLAASGILTPSEIEVLNDRHGSYQDYYASLQAAEKNADTIISFMNGLDIVRHGPYDKLDVLGKVRYNLFCRWGLLPPTQWTLINPVIKGS